MSGCRYYSQCFWFHSPSIYSSGFRLRVYLNGSLRALAGYARLGSGNRCPDQIALKFSLPSGSTLPQVIMFDEWLGVIAVQYVNRSLGRHHDHVAIIRVGTLGDDAFDANSRFLLQQFNLPESQFGSRVNSEVEQRNAIDGEGIDRHKDIQGSGSSDKEGSEYDKSCGEEESGESGKDVGVAGED
jgi:hypothetical protein